MTIKNLQEFPTGLPTPVVVDGITQADGDARFLRLDQTTPQYIVNGYPVGLATPTFTYTAGVLTRIDYPSGYYKVFSYNGDGTLASVNYNGEHTKTFTYSSGVLQSIGVS